MDVPVRIGVIGVGRIGQFAHLKSFQRVEGCQVTAISDLRPRLLAQVAEDYNVPKTYASHRELIDDPDIDAVVVVTRNIATGPIVIDALRGGKHVLSEKPMAHTSVNAERIRSLAKDAGVIYAVGFMKRHDTGVLWAKSAHQQVSKDGSLGKLLMVRGHCLQGDDGCPPLSYAMTDEERPDGLETWPPVPEWLTPDLHQDYSKFVNVNSHMVDLVSFLMGEPPTALWADASYADRQTIGMSFDTCVGTLTFAEKTEGEWCEGLQIDYEKGQITIDLPPPLSPQRSARVTVIRGRDKETFSDSDPVWAFQHQAEAFVSGVNSGELTGTGADEGAEGVRFIEDVWRLAMLRTGDVKTQIEAR